MIFILIPIYNEEDNITSLSKELTHVLKDFEKFYVFANDGSTDNSVALLSSEFKNVNFVILGDGTNNGPGYAFNLGFEWILANSKDDDLVVTMEADGTSDVQIMENMVLISLLGFDLVLASVYSQGGGFKNTTLIRRLISAVANIVFRLAFDLKVQTLSSFYRVYQVRLLHKVKKKYNSIVSESGFISMIEILLKSIHVGAQTIEVPMKLDSSKRVGKSKMKILRTALQYLLFIIRFKNE